MSELLGGADDLPPKYISGIAVPEEVQDYWAYERRQFVPGMPVYESYPLNSEQIATTYDGIAASLGSMALEPPVLQKTEGMRKPVRHLDKYALVPVLPYDPAALARSMDSENCYLRPTYAARFEYLYRDGQPHVDGRLIAGLAYDGRLVAMCGGGLTTEGLVIKQIQDVAYKNRTLGRQADRPAGPTANADGLRGGIDWRMTLVRAWHAAMTAVVSSAVFDGEQPPVWLQGAINNYWARRPIAQPDGTVGGTIVNPPLLRRLVRTYDGTALRLGGTFDPASHNYLLPKELPAAG